jgi:hypothetical protein
MARKVRVSCNLFSCYRLAFVANNSGMSALIFGASIENGEDCWHRDSQLK